MRVVRMIKDGYGSDVNEKGVTMAPRHYLRGTEHELGDALARAFVDELGLAEDVNGEKAEAKAPENKMSAAKHAKKGG